MPGALMRSCRSSRKGFANHGKSLGQGTASRTLYFGTPAARNIFETIFRNSGSLNGATLS